MKSKAVKTYLNEKSNLDRGLAFLFEEALRIQDQEQEQRRKTMLKNKDKTNEGGNLKAMELIESTQHQLKEIHLYYGVLKDTEDIKRIKNNEINRLIKSVEKTLLDKHHYSEEEIKGINWGIDPKEHERFREWCARTGNDFHRYETLDKYLNL